MSDIFDEVDEILGDVDATSEEVEVANLESNFNESELQDIMAEIESLEKDFAGSDDDKVIVVPVKAEARPEELAISTPREEVKKTNLQEEIERELETSMTVEEIAPVSETLSTAASAKVLSFDKPAAPVMATAPVASGSAINFQGAGQMTMSLGFKIGSEEAKLTIDPTKGLIVTMNGVELYINEETGCTVTMENGVHFSIPLTQGSAVSKKKAV